MLLQRTRCSLVSEMDEAAHVRLKMLLEVLTTVDLAQ